MQSIQGYTVTERVFESGRSIVERGRRNADGRPVIIKRLRQDFPNADEIARFRREFRIGQQMGIPGVIEVYSLERSSNGFAIVMEDFGGESLARCTGGRPLPVQQFLELAIQLSEALGGVHRRHVIHKDINPGNIVWNARTGTLKLIDFGIATELERETAVGTGGLEGTLSYISPEQTGRMNRAIDYRTDFYSLGVTFYELLTGQRPFTASDPLELVHSHIARTPRAPHELMPSVPRILSDIVLKLMSKRAEERYQSALALSKDLEQCLERLAAGHIEPFPIAQRDFSGRFQLPQKLYGREREIDALLGAFHRVAAGGFELMLVAGYSGIGKSALVHEVHKPIVEKRGYFVSGKFDQYNRKVPYASLIQAFRALVRQLLTESPERLAAWKQKLMAALGASLQVLVGVIPELELVVGPHPPVPELPPKEAQHRFNLAFERLFGAFCGQAHPLVMFLDDLQWADLPSLQLLEQLSADPDVHHLLIIGAYRDNEVEATHPLTLTLEEMRKQGARIEMTRLGPLALNHCTEFLADLLSRERADVAPLAELCLRHTGGNPFFLSQYLLSLHEQGIFELDGATGRWCWEVERLASASVTDNVVELMSAKIQRLAPEVRRVTQLAACIGNKFDLQTLAVVSGGSVEQTAAALWPALQEGLLVPEGNAYKFVEDLAVALSLVEPGTSPHPLKDRGGEAGYRFLHDRVQQAAYSLFPESERQSLHLRIGRLLRDGMQPEARNERLFEIVNHLNAGASLVTDPAEREAIAGLNLAAARRANASAARGAALAHCRTGLKLLGEDSWQRQYELTLALHLQAAEAAYLVSEFEEMEHHIDAVDRHARELLEKVPAYEIRTEAFIARTRPRDALDTALALVRELIGVEFPENPGPADVGAYLEEAKSALAGRPIPSLVDQPPMEDARTRAAMRMLAKITSATYHCSPPLFPLIILRMAILGLTQGYSGAVGYGYGLYGLILAAVLGDIDNGYEFGRLATRLAERPDAKELETRTCATVTCFLTHLKESLHGCVATFKENCRTGLEGGDTEYSLYSAYWETVSALHAGHDLAELEQQCERYAETAARLKQETSVRFQRAVLTSVRSLRGEEPEPWRMVNADYDFDRMMALHQEAKDASGLAWGHANKLLLLSFFGRTEEAMKLLPVMEGLLGSILGTPYVDVVHLHSSLTLLAACADAAPEERARLLEKVEVNQQQLKSRAEHAPMNRAHMYALVEAERLRVLGQPEAARASYYRAMALAAEHHFPNHQALAAELFARFLLAGGEVEVGQLFLAKARHLYELWGARAKVRALDARHPSLRPATRSTRTLDSTVGTTTDGGSSGALDFLSVLRASQAISGEVVLPELLKKIMGLVIENAGARRGLMLLPGEHPLVVEMDGTPEQGTQVVIHPGVLGERADVSMAMVRYVERTRETVVLGDASKDRGAFQTDAYFSRGKSKSVACLPILHHGSLAGVLYLENELLANAFTPERCHVLKLLSAQAAISLENARLYETLDNRVNERTRELSEALEDLRLTQRKLVTQEKLASLGMLTSGIAHELKNPLNFIKNFAELSLGLADELRTELERQSARLQAEALGSLRELAGDLRQNSSKIFEHGRRADDIVSSMLQHARTTTTGTFEQVDFNRLATQALQQAYEGFRLQNVTFQALIETRCEPSLPPVTLMPSRIDRVITNLVRNACYALQVRMKQPGSFAPILRVSTRDCGDKVELRVWDNGCGIPESGRERVFTPFFTTKPAGEGTGLGLSLSYDIVANGHGGTLEFDSREGAYTEFVLTLPKHQPEAPASRTRR